MKKLYIIMAVAVLFYGLIVGWLLWEPYSRPKWPAAEKMKVVERHKYHGIEASICEGDVCYFYREGKRAGYQRSKRSSRSVECPTS